MSYLNLEKRCSVKIPLEHVWVNSRNSAFKLCTSINFRGMRQVKAEMSPMQWVTAVT